MSVSALRRPDHDGMACEAAIAADRPIDLVHLSRQTLGDRQLEVELLQLFDRQAAQIAARLGADTGNTDRRWRQDLSHTLKGSARAVGAEPGCERRATLRKTYSLRPATKARSSMRAKR